jgi:hypothetical protein
MRIRIIAASAAAVLAPLAGIGGATAAHAATHVPAGKAPCFGASCPKLSDGHASVDGSRATVTWRSTVTSDFEVTIAGPGQINGKMSPVTSPEAVYSGLLAGHTYTVTIQAMVTGFPHGKTGKITFRTVAPAPVLSGGHATATTRHATVTWKCTVTSAFTVTITGPGPLNGRTSTVTRPQAVYSGVEPGHVYRVKIQPLVNGHPAGRSGLVTWRTLFGGPSASR